MTRWSFAAAFLARCWFAFENVFLLGGTAPRSSCHWEAWTLAASQTPPRGRCSAG